MSMGNIGVLKVDLNYVFLCIGEMKYQDSVGNNGVLKEGWVQWMIVGFGVVYSEMLFDEFLKRGGRLEGF